MPVHVMVEKSNVFGRTDIKVKTWTSTSVTVHEGVKVHIKSNFKRFFFSKLNQYKYVTDKMIMLALIKPNPSP